MPFAASTYLQSVDNVRQKICEATSYKPRILETRNVGPEDMGQSRTPHPHCKQNGDALVWEAKCLCEVVAQTVDCLNHWGVREPARIADSEQDTSCLGSVASRWWVGISTLTMS